MTNSPDLLLGEALLTPEMEYGEPRQVIDFSEGEGETYPVVLKNFTGEDIEVEAEYEIRNVLDFLDKTTGGRIHEVLEEIVITPRKDDRISNSMGGDKRVTIHVGDRLNDQVRMWERNLVFVEGDEGEGVSWLKVVLARNVGHLLHWHPANAPGHSISGIDPFIDTEGRANLERAGESAVFSDVDFIDSPHLDAFRSLIDNITQDNLSVDYDNLVLNEQA